MMMRVRRTLSEARSSTVYPAPTGGFGRAKPDRDVGQTTLLGDMLDFQRSGQVLARYELKRHVADRRLLSCLGLLECVSNHVKHGQPVVWALRCTRGRLTMLVDGSERVGLAGRLGCRRSGWRATVRDR